MKTIGLIGGLSPQSTAEYYTAINDGVRQRLGGLNGADMLVASVNQEEVTSLREQGRWDRVGEILTDRAKRLEGAGAGCILIACNSVHHVADALESEINIPFLHIAECTAMPIQRAGLQKVGLLGTRYTMEMDFYHARLGRFGVEALVPGGEDRETVNTIIFGELCKGIVRPESKQAYIDISKKLLADGAQGLILGCTEIGMLIGQDDFEAPVFDSTRLHVEAVLEFALGNLKTEGEAA